MFEAVTAQLAAAGLLPIPGEWLIQGGAVGMLALVAWMVFTGKLVPRQVYRDMEKDRDQWRDVALKAMGHNDQLLPAAQITAHVTQALAERAGGGPMGERASARGSFDAAAVQQALAGQRLPREETP